MTDERNELVENNKNFANRLQKAFLSENLSNSEGYLEEIQNLKEQIAIGEAQLRRPVISTSRHRRVPGPWKAYQDLGQTDRSDFK